MAKSGIAGVVSNCLGQLGAVAEFEIEAVSYVNTLSVLFLPTILWQIRTNSPGSLMYDCHGTTASFCLCIDGMMHRLMSLGTTWPL